MRDRLITAAGAVAALLAAYALFFQASDEPPVTRPLSIEAGRNGYLAASRWLRREGVPVVSLRERYTRLLDTDAPAAPRGNVMITTMPHAARVRAIEHEAIGEWLERGNTLLIMAALNDTPEWLAVTDTSGFMEQLRALSGLRFYSPREVEQVRAGSVEGPQAGPRGIGPEGDIFVVAAGSVVELEPVAAHPLMEGVERLEAYSDDSSDLWSAWPEESEGPALSLAVERRARIGAGWELARGEGRIVVLASASLLANHRIAESDAGRFLANLLRHHLGPGGSVIFDDMHQGLSVLYDPDAFFGDPRVHRTLWFLVAAWLVYVLGSSNRLAPPMKAPAAPRQDEFLAASGGFMARRLSYRDAGLVLMEEWFDEIRRHAADGGGPPWSALESMTALGADLRAELRHLHERLASGRSVDLLQLHNTLQRARRAIG